MTDEYTKTAFSLKTTTLNKLKKKCPKLVPLSRYLNSILEKEFSTKGSKKL